MAVEAALRRCRPATAQAANLKPRRVWQSGLPQLVLKSSRQQFGLIKASFALSPVVQRDRNKNPWRVIALQSERFPQQKKQFSELIAPALMATELQV